MKERDEETYSLREISAFPDYETVVGLYQKKGAWGLLSSLDMSACDASIIRSKEALHEYVIELCKQIGMKRFGEPQIVHFGEDEHVAGYSVVQLIETSLISGHFANKTNTAYIDIFSCKVYDPQKAAKFSKEFFKAERCTLNILFRK
jgi:S-adenosylmethionine/arginine decarboxylase-like enzyme